MKVEQRVRFNLANSKEIGHITKNEYALFSEDTKSKICRYYANLKDSKNLKNRVNRIIKKVDKRINKRVSKFNRNGSFRSEIEMEEKITYLKK